MKLKHKVIWCILGIVATLLLVPAYFKVFSPPYSETPIYITAAHLDPSTVTGYTLIYSDEDRDTAYYIKDDYTYHYPEIGETVYFANCKGTVDSIKEGVGFYVSVDKDSEIYKGLSGARVKDSRGKDIAFVSSAKSKEKILCVSLY